MLGVLEMKYIDVLQVDAFSRSPFAGNPAGVVLTAEGLGEDSMQNIAREMNCSETAFIFEKAPGQLRFRYFTPATEVDLCGHATVAAMHALHSEKSFAGRIVVETNVGSLNMEVTDEGLVWMEQAGPQFRPQDASMTGIIAELLGVRGEDIDTSIPIGLAYTGLWDLMVPLRTLDVVKSLRPNLTRLADLNRQQGAASTHVYCFDTVLPGSTLHARDFSPAVGVPEDPHTGTASGALGAWLVNLGVLKPGVHTFEQGWSVGRPGLIQVEVGIHPLRVRVGGQAVTVLKGTMTVEVDHEQ